MVTVADTAFSIAVVRAEEGGKADALFEDPFARLFASAGEHAREATQRYLDLPFFWEGIRLRTRFIDDFVREGIAAGLANVVLLGAGFDARGMRMKELASARVFEVDSPDQLERKKSILDAAKITLPKNITYVPFDYASRDLERELPRDLAAVGFRGPALFVWEGVIGYIDLPAIEASLRFMARAGTGTRVVFTHGEMSFHPETAETCVKRAGFTRFEDFTGHDLWKRYWTTPPHPYAAAMHMATALDPLLG